MAIGEIQAEAQTNRDKVKQAPYYLPVQRLDEVKAAKDLDIVWQLPKITK